MVIPSKLKQCSGAVPSDAGCTLICKVHQIHLNHRWHCNTRSKNVQICPIFYWSSSIRIDSRLIACKSYKTWYSNIFYNKILNSIFRLSYIFDVIPHIQFASSTHFQNQLCSTSSILYTYQAMFIAIKELQ